MYVAPEIMMQYAYDYKVDVYSFSIVLLECGLGDAHFVVNQFRRRGTSAVVPGWRPVPTKTMTENMPDLWRLIQSCWKVHPSDRPTFEDIAKALKPLRGSLEDSKLVQGAAGKSSPRHSDEQIRGAGRLESSILRVFEGVSPADVDATLRLRRDIQATASPSDLSLLSPEHIGGDVALLRIHLCPYAGFAPKMIEARRELNADAIYRELLNNACSIHTIPGTADLRAASWETNYWLGVDNEGAVICFQRWGSIDPDVLLAKFSLERYKRWYSYAFEARCMLLDLLSRRRKRIVQYNAVIDMDGFTLAHRKLIPYVKVYLNDEHVTWSSPPCWGGSTFFVRFGTIASTFIKLAKMFAHRRLLEGASTIAGNPFISSEEFRNRFNPRSLPEEIGGKLPTGAEVGSPGLGDRDAVWKHYASQMLPHEQYVVQILNENRDLLLTADQKDEKIKEMQLHIARLEADVARLEAGDV